MIGPMAPLPAGATISVRRLDTSDDLATFGQIVLDSYQALPGHPTEPEYDAEMLKELPQWFEKHYSIQFANYPVGDEYLTCGKKTIATKRHDKAQ